MKIRIGTRESRLAVIQTEIVADNIRKNFPDIEIEIITMKTTGDIILDKTLDKIGGKGLFVKELDKALLENRVDITVHSCKDLPMDINPDLPLVAVSKRENPRDVLVLPTGKNFLDPKLPVGCSSKRRLMQLKKIYPETEIKPIRGNVITRLEKLDSGEFSGLILAYAGLKRLGLTERISRVFETNEIIPSAGQGVLAVQSRKDFDCSFLEKFNDLDVFEIVKAERSFVRVLDGGCSSPIAAYGSLKRDKILLTGMYVDDYGNIFTDTLKGSKESAEDLGESLAIKLKKASDEFEKRKGIFSGSRAGRLGINHD